MQKKYILFILIFVLSAIFPLVSYSASATIDDIRVNHLASKIQYVVDLSGMVPVTEHTDDHPFKKVFSFYHVILSKRVNTAHLANSQVSSVVIQTLHDRVLLGLHLKNDYPVHASFWSNTGSKHTRYVIEIDKHVSTREKQKSLSFDRSKALSELNSDVGPSIHSFVDQHLGAKDSGSEKSQTSTHPEKPVLNVDQKSLVSDAALQKKAPQEDSNEVQVPVVTSLNSDEKAKRYSSKVIVVIDPGHGGKDPGATGPAGTHEKKVVLAIAKRLQSAINSNPGFKAVLTRGDDRYLSLRYRLALAREYHGDMFVAIHADAYINASASGASVFALSSRGATSEAARWLAQRENQSELMGGVDLADKDPTLRSVLIDLSQTATISASLQMGSGIMAQLRQVVPMHVNHVEQAAFVVLKSPDIPSLLIETGFLSNPTEEQQLIMASHQEQLADAMANGIVQYFTRNPPEGSWLATQKNS
jgi:N-acetylmuramoyl-L-alanine amidase